MPDIKNDQRRHLRWRPMSAGDLPGVVGVADRVHENYREDPEVFVERLDLFPKGCVVLADEIGVAGYVLSHPWAWEDAPRLNSMLGALPMHPTTYYVHDIAIMPRGQAQGHAHEAIRRLATRARALNLPHLSLVAVNNSREFWRKHGFEEHAAASLRRKLESYGEDAAFMVRRIDASSS